jgi:hypothetical protein
MSGDRKVVEVGKIAPTLSPFHSQYFFFRAHIVLEIIGVDRLAVQHLGEVQQQLRKAVRGLQTIRARAIVPLPEPFQLQLQTQIFTMQLFSPSLLFFGTQSLLVALQHQRVNICFQRFVTFR